MRSAAHLEAFLIKQGVPFFLNVSNVLGMCRVVRMQSHASFAKACHNIYLETNTEASVFHVCLASLSDEK